VARPATERSKRRARGKEVHDERDERRLTDIYILYIWLLAASDT
jgi:hypothetical protein